MLHFYWLVLRGTPALLWRAVREITGGITVLAFFLLLFNRQIGGWLMNWWEGVSPWWAVVPVAILVVHLWLRRAYVLYEAERQRANKAEVEVGRMTETAATDVAHGGGNLQALIDEGILLGE